MTSSWLSQITFARTVIVDAMATQGRADATNWYASYVTLLFKERYAPGWQTFPNVNSGTLKVTYICCFFFTRGQFWPSGIVVACVCVYVCVHVSVNHELVRTIIHQPFKLGSPNLDQRCKRPWLRSLLFCGAIDLDFQGQIELKSKKLPHFEHVSLSA